MNDCESFNSKKQDRAQFLNNLKEIVNLFPENIALEEGCKKITYFELWKEMKTIARSNLRFIETGDVVAIGFGRSMKYISLFRFYSFTSRFVIHLLAIWYCGAIFLPIDPFYPLKRIDYILRNAKPKAIFGLDNCDRSKYITKIKRKNVNDEGEFNAPSYLIFTSGSTGNPKGYFNISLKFQPIYPDLLFFILLHKLINYRSISRS
jgi:acyl-CoA synthetase (AMP-forming)/AMP-acid ligase II